jgi:hypothetical protein
MTEAYDNAPVDLAAFEGKLEAVSLLLAKSHRQLLDLLRLLREAREEADR